MLIRPYDFEDLKRELDELDLESYTYEGGLFTGSGVEYVLEFQG